MKLTSWKYFIIVLRILIGAILPYSGLYKINTFLQDPAPYRAEESLESPARSIQFIEDLKRTGYFWQFLGVVELTCGVLIMSQYLSLLGAVLSMPVSVNFLLFQLFLGYQNAIHLILTVLFFVCNIILISYNYRSLKSTFLKFKLI